MASFGAAILVGALLLILGSYMVLGPFTSNKAYNMEPFQAQPFSLPSWYDFPVGTSIQVSWSGMSPGSSIAVVACQSISSNGQCQGASSPIEQGYDSSGSFTFVASSGQLYGIVASSLGIVTTTAEYSSTAGILIFFIFTMAVICFAIAIMNYSRGADRYRPL